MRTSWPHGVKCEQRISHGIGKVGYTLFANHNRHGWNESFTEKNCKFAKHEENHATLSVDCPKFRAWVFFFSLCEKLLRVCHVDRSPDKTRWTEFDQTLQNTFYALFVVRTNFIVSSQFHCGSRIVCSTLKRETSFSTKFLLVMRHDVTTTHQLVNKHLQLGNIKVHYGWRRGTWKQ